jgi:outer membrane lipoprotein SlyB
MKDFTPIILLLVMSGCATLPTGPSVRVLPAQGKPFDTFRAEDATCRQWAEQQMGMSTQQTYDKNVATGAVAGTAIGAGLGAAVGAASGNAGAGAAIGAASGLLLGTAEGSEAGQVHGMEAQRRYDNAYVQCMYSYGNQVPGYSRRVIAPPPQSEVATPPPPPPDAVAQTDVPPPPPPEVLPEQGQYPPPPEIYLDEAPQFIYSPALNLYVAVGVPYDLIYTGTGYFYFYGGHWYRGPYYNGPWLFATRGYLPRVLLRYRIDKIRYFRDAEFRRFQHDRAHYKGRFHHPEFRGERRR